MKSHDHQRLRDVIDRLGRIVAADEWSDAVNPTQWTALSYLARANRFSRSPSQVADYMEATRGTVSQTLKALARKGLITEIRSEQDKRSISYSVTKEGLSVLDGSSLIAEAAASLPERERSALIAGLEALIHKALQKRGSRAFGVCETCTFHEKRDSGGYCRLLDEPLAPLETGQICHEHSDPGPANPR